MKVVLLGDQGVGKSSLVLRFVTNNFKINSDATIGASFMSKMIMVPNGEDGMIPINFKIWDTAPRFLKFLVQDRVEDGVDVFHVLDQQTSAKAQGRFQMFHEIQI